MSEFGQALRLVVFGVYALFVAFVNLDTGSVDGFGSLIFGLAIFAWALSPVAALAFTRQSVLPKAIAAVLVAAWGDYQFYRNFYAIPLDPQSALVLLFIPLYQWFVVAPILLGLFLSATHYPKDLSQ